MALSCAPFRDLCCADVSFRRASGLRLFSMETGVQEQSLRIAIVGPECSGKTTLCADIKKATDCFVVDEFAREYMSQRKGRVYDHKDLIRMAHVQAKRNKAATGALHVCDTEMTTLAIWAQKKLGGIPPRILELEREQVFDHYFLCSPEMPWEPDPLRENETSRDELFESYSERLGHLNRPFVVLEGSAEERLQKVLSVLT